MAVRIGFIGCGKMAQALARGFLDSGIATRADLAGSDIADSATKVMRESLGVAICPNNSDLVARSDAVIIAVKPQSVDALLAEIRGALTEDHLVVSIAAGVSLTRLASSLGETRRIIRVMPNTPCLVGKGASAFAAGSAATDDDRLLVARLLASVGLAIPVPEALMDAVTGLSGSGPAYIYQVIEALSDGGVQVGLPRDVATKLAAQTVLGAAQMVLETGMHPGQLKDMVTSPGGTTIEGIAVLEQRGVRSAFIDAVARATERSRELGAKS